MKCAGLQFNLENAINFCWALSVSFWASGEQLCEARATAHLKPRRTTSTQYAHTSDRGLPVTLPELLGTLAQSPVCEKHSLALPLKCSSRCPLLPTNTPRLTSQL